MCILVGAFSRYLWRDKIRCKIDIRGDYNEFVYKKSHNVTYIMYHIVCPIKYRKMIINEELDWSEDDVVESIESRINTKFKGRVYKELAEEIKDLAKKAIEDLFDYQPELTAKGYTLSALDFVRETFGIKLKLNVKSLKKISKIVEKLRASTVGVEDIDEDMKVNVCKMIGCYISVVCVNNNSNLAWSGYDSENELG